MCLCFALFGRFVGVCRFSELMVHMLKDDESKAFYCDGRLDCCTDVFFVIDEFRGASGLYDCAYICVLRTNAMGRVFLSFCN